MKSVVFVSRAYRQSALRVFRARIPPSQLTPLFHRHHRPQCADLIFPEWHIPTQITVTGIQLAIILLVLSHQAQRVLQVQDQNVKTIQRRVQILVDPADEVRSERDLQVLDQLRGALARRQLRFARLLVGDAFHVRAQRSDIILGRVFLAHGCQWVEELDLLLVRQHGDYFQLVRRQIHRFLHWNKIGSMRLTHKRTVF